MRAASAHIGEDIITASCQMLASRRLVPMNEPKEAAKRIEARWNDGPVLVIVSGSDEMSREC
jgi:hypothetical protein